MSYFHIQFRFTHQHLLGIPVKRKGSGAGNLFDADRLEQAQQCLYFALIAGDFNGVLFGSHVDNFAPEDIDDTQNFGPRLCACLDADQCHFSFDGFFNAQIPNFDDIDQLWIY